MASHGTRNPASDIRGKGETHDHLPPLLVLWQPIKQFPIESQEARLYLHISGVSTASRGGKHPDYKAGLRIRSRPELVSRLKSE